MSNERSSILAYVWVFIALLLLLALTVVAAQFDMGPWNFLVAAAIACTKAVLIVLFFMHVKKSVPLTRMVIAAGLFWLGILFTLSFADYWSRSWDQSMIPRINQRGSDS